MEEKELTIDKKEEGAKVTFALTGRLNTNTAPELEAEVENLPADTESLIFDLENLEYLSSAGLRVLLFGKKTMGNKEMRILNASDEVLEIFDVTGFTDILMVE